METSSDLLLINLENRMLSQLCTICDVSSDTSRTQELPALSFSGILAGALAEETGTASSSDGSDAVSASSGNSLSALYASYVLGNTSSASAFDKTRAAGGMRVSDSMMRFIAEHEGFSSTAYRGADSQNLTIGYGHVLGAGESSAQSLTKEQGLDLLKSDLSRYEDSVNQEFSDIKLTQNQFDALVSFSYNLGANIWSRVPTLVNDIKSGASAETLKSDFASCDHCNGVELEGLLRRRLDEWQLFETPEISS